MKRDNCFGFLRFVFALIIVIAHLRVLTQLPELQWTKVLSLAVNRTAFFVISGFLIMVSYDHSESIKHFFIKRARRIFPAYITVIVGCAVGLVLLSTYAPMDYFTHPMWWKYIAANLCFLNFLQPCLPGVFESDALVNCSVNGALWTQKVEVGFYLIVPLLAYMLHHSKRSWLWLALIYLFSVLWSNVCLHMADHTGQSFYVFLEHQLPGCLSYFAAGMFAYQYKEVFLKYRHWILIPAVFIVVFEKIMGISWLQPAGNAAILLWCAYSLPRLNKLEWMGNFSYGMYLYHYPIITIMLSLGIFERWNAWVASGTVIAIVLILSVASWHLMEKRIIKR